MKPLSPDWFIDGTLDFEIKKYAFLAYLQQVSREFSEVRLYPALGDLIHQHQNLHQFKSQKQDLQRKFPAQLTDADFSAQRLIYEPTYEDPEDLLEIDQIVDFAIPELEVRMQEGKEIYDYIEECMTIEPIGITPLRKQEGYLLLRMHPRNEVNAYQYRITNLYQNNHSYQGIAIEQVYSFTHSIANSYESMKRQLIQSRTELPNPATYLVFTSAPIPESPSLLPVAKRRMLAIIND